MKLPLQTLTGTPQEEVAVELDDAVFGVEIRPDVLQRVVRWQLAGRQAGTHSTQSRGEVSYSTRKIQNQKRTGRARHGTRSAGIFRQGAVAGGPKPRSHAHGLPKRVRRLGLCMALSDKVRRGKLVVLDSLALEDARTRTLRGSSLVPRQGGVLVIGGGELDPNFCRAARNLPGLHVLPSRAANVYDILRRSELVLTREAVDELEARLK